MSRKQIRFNDMQELELNLFMKKTQVKELSKAVHLAIQYALKYFNLVTKALETDEFELCFIKKTKEYRKKNNPEFKDF